MQSADGPATPESVGSVLASARRAAGLSVDDVSARTRIRASLITQIEQDDFTNCGGAVYARGHLRTIATTLGLDPAPLLASYDAQHEHERAPSPLVVPTPEFDPLHGGGRGGRGGFRWVPAMIASLAVVCALALVALVVPSGGGDSGDATTASGQPRSSAGASAPSAGPVAPSPLPTTPPPPGVNVQISARSAQSWLEVRDDSQQVLLQQLLQQGDTREVSSEGPLEIKMGNAGAVDLSCNGRTLPPAGGPGEVVTIRLTLAVGGGGCEVGGQGANNLATGALVR